MTTTYLPIRDRKRDRKIPIRDWGAAGTCSLTEASNFANALRAPRKAENQHDIGTRTIIRHGVLGTVCLVWRLVDITTRTIITVCFVRWFADDCPGLIFGHLSRRSTRLQRGRQPPTPHLRIPSHPAPSASERVSVSCCLMCVCRHIYMCVCVPWVPHRSCRVNFRRMVLPPYIR
jgi:hypothetical protein